MLVPVGAGRLRARTGDEAHGRCRWSVPLLVGDEAQRKPPVSAGIDGVREVPRGPAASRPGRAGLDPGDDAGLRGAALAGRTPATSRPPRWPSCSTGRRCSTGSPARGGVGPPRARGGETGAVDGLGARRSGGRSGLTRSEGGSLQPGSASALVPRRRPLPHRADRPGDPDGRRPAVFPPTGAAVDTGRRHRRSRCSRCSRPIRPPWISPRPRASSAAVAPGADDVAGRAMFGSAAVALALGCSTGGTRVVTDWGWLPFERQIGTDRRHGAPRSVPGLRHQWRRAARGRPGGPRPRHQREHRCLVPDDGDGRPGHRHRRAGAGRRARPSTRSH